MKKKKPCFGLAFFSIYYLVFAPDVTFARSSAEGDIHHVVREARRLSAAIETVLTSNGHDASLKTIDSQLFSLIYKVSETGPINFRGVQNFSMRKFQSALEELWLTDFMLHAMPSPSRSHESLEELRSRFSALDKQIGDTRRFVRTVTETNQSFHASELRSLWNKLMVLRNLVALAGEQVELLLRQDQEYIVRAQNESGLRKMPKLAVTMNSAMRALQFIKRQRCELLVSGL